MSSLAASLNNDQAIVHQNAASTSKIGISSSSSSSNGHLLSSSADVHHVPKDNAGGGSGNNLNDVSQSQQQPRVAASVNLHGEISNPPSPLGGRANTSNAQQRPDSPQAGPSGSSLKRQHAAMSDPSSSSSSSTGEAKQRRQSLDSQPGPSGLQNMLVRINTKLIIIYSIS